MEYGRAMAKRVIEIDGNAFDTLEGFYDEVGRAILDDRGWARNLDAFSDILRGGFGTPDEGFVLRWLNSPRSERMLGYPATIEYLEEKILRCHPSNVVSVQADLESAHRGEGQTLFQILVDIIRTHAPGGEEQEDGVELELA
jgi:RNAse (barnase) inhibitor barstar